MKSQWSAKSCGIFDAVMPMKPDLDAARAHPVGPRGLVLVIDERRQDERDVGRRSQSPPRVHFTS